MGAFADQQDTLEKERNFAKWEDPGQIIEGRVVYAGMVGHPFPDATKPQRVPRVDLDDSGTVVEVTATLHDLSRKLIAADPEVGDYLVIEYAEDVKVKGRPMPMKRFRVTKGKPETIKDQIQKDKARRAKTLAGMPDEPPF